MTFEIRHGDAVEVMAAMQEASIDAVVTDPPYGLEFMGKDWDSGAVTFRVETWREALRVLRPGGHLLAFGGTRTYHRLACAIEDAGFEIRDCLQWLYGSGFPKSLDVSKAIDKAAGAEREVVGDKLNRPGYHLHGHAGGEAFGHGLSSSTPETRLRSALVTAPATDAAAAWAGWGTALKPACEPIVLARKPLVGTVAANVLQHGTGALNIDGCRIETSDNLSGGAYSGGRRRREEYSSSDAADGAVPLSRLDRGLGAFDQPLGRWPANVLLDEEAAAQLDEQSGTLVSGFMAAGTQREGLGYHGALGTTVTHDTRGDSGGASRFFYTAKAGSGERHYAGKNTHPTVKPVDLMRWLCRLVTPKGGLVLDPFMGSGSTGVAALAEGFRFIGIEREAEYVEIARRRIAGPLFAEHAP